MSAPGGAAAIGAVLLALAAAGGAARLAAWWVRAPKEARSAPWRLALLLAAQPLLALLLFLALFPAPEGGRGGETLVIATRGASRLTAARPGERLVVLPEAPKGLDGERAPDLATALRRHGGARLRVAGFGLEARDRPAAAGAPLAFDPAPLPRGLVELHAPGPVAAGGTFAFRGRAEGVAGGRVELADPGGRTVDSAALSPDGTFVLAGTAREPGPALWTVRLRDRTRAVVDTLEAPQVTAGQTAPRLLLLAGAAGPEVKTLRRWADAVGAPLRTTVAAGGGLELGDPRPPLNAATLDALDLVVVDERSWGALDASDRAALAAAVTRGLGLLLRITGPTPAPVRTAWRALGLPLDAGEAAIPVRLPSAPAAPAAVDEPAAPDLTRRGADAPAPGSTPLLRDAAGQVLGRWRPQGSGRLGVWTVADSAGWVTAGFGDRYAAIWSTLVSTLARGDGPPAATVEPLIIAGRRLSACGLRGRAELDGPGAAITPMLPDGLAGGCAAAWPQEGGWRTLRVVDPAGRPLEAQPLYVRPPGSAPGLLAQEARDATLALAGGGPSDARGPALDGRGAPPAWAWLLAFLAVATACWGLERAPAGRPRRT